MNVEYCADCPYVVNPKEDIVYCIYENLRKKLDWDSFEEGFIPEWCPLPKEEG